MATNRIRTLQTSLPRGAPFDTASLARVGVSVPLAHAYVRGGWLEKLGRGVFMFAGDRLERDRTLAFLGTRIPGLHVAARTALAWHGFAHNIAMRETTILWGRPRAVLPGWFLERFPARYSSCRLFDDGLPPGTGMAPLPEAPLGLPVSGPERALLEMLGEVGVRQEAGEARAVMEGLRQLRTAQLEILLPRCRMVKAVRLCVVWARELGLPWAGAAREAASGRMGSGRWITRHRNGTTLIVNPG